MAPPTTSAPPAPPAPRTPRAASQPAERAAPAPAAGFDPRALTPRQLDELTHRLTGRITRLLRAELRQDRERIGRLRDTPR
ncbi:hypothetical protein [Streptomyces mayteni]